MSNARLPTPEIPLPRYDQSAQQEPVIKHGMVESLSYKCPTALGLPEPLRVGYQEEVRDYGYLYVHAMLAMKHRLSVGVKVSPDISAVKALTVRCSARASLIRRFWRTLGAA